jgi:hypothetical protein
MEETQEMSVNEQSREDKPTLEDLLTRITGENRHPEVDWGEPVGEEVVSGSSPGVQHSRIAVRRGRRRAGPSFG